MDNQEMFLQNEERIDKYLRGKMTQDEMSLFENDLKTDETLRRQATAMAQMVHTMAVSGKVSDMDIIKKLSEAETSEATSSTRHIGRWISIAASVVLVFFAGIKYYDYSSTVSLGKEYLSTFSTESIIRGESSETDSILAVLHNNIAEGHDLNATSKRLGELWQTAKSDTYNEYTDYAPYIGWDLAMCHLCQGHKKKAKKVLLEMSELYPQGTAMGDKVYEIIDRLKL